MSFDRTPISFADRQPLPARDPGLIAPAPREILSSIGEAIYDWDMVSDRISWGPNADVILPVAERDNLANGRSYASLVSMDSSSTRLEAVLQAATADTGSGALYQVEYGIMLDPDSRNSARLWIEDTGRCFAGADGRPVRAHGVIRIVQTRGGKLDKSDAHERKAMNDGPMTRVELTACINRLFAESRPGQNGFAMLLVAIDGLAAINRTSGYDAGDALIALTLQKIRARMRATDLIARYAGNKFALVLQNCDADQIRFAAGRFLEAVNGQEMRTAGVTMKLAARAGAVCAPRDARLTQQLFQHAEEALDAARAQPTRYAAYSASIAIDYERLRNQAIAEHIVEALNQRRIAIALQPIVAARTGKPVFFEALMRLTAEDGRDIAPASIVPVAEKTGLITLLDQRVLELAIDRLVAEPNLTLSVNVSGVTMESTAWLEHARSRFAAHAGIANRLIAEITETCAIGDVEIMREKIAAIRETGMRVAMDDFGAGYSSFRNLRGLGIDLLKIDGAFIQNLARSPDDRFFVRTLIDLAGHLQIPLVAEWVENQETATLLAEWGVDYCQGSWFGMGITHDSDVLTSQDSAAA